MSKQQWGHGFHKGKQAGEKWGELVADGKWEGELSVISDRLVLLAAAMRYPLIDHNARTDTWWALHSSAVAKEIQAIAELLPGNLVSVHEFDASEPDGQGATPC